MGGFKKLYKQIKYWWSKRKTKNDEEEEVVYMSKLKKLYKQMKDRDLTYTIFDYRHNKIELIALFDIGVDPFRLLLIKKGTQLTLSLNVKYGFILDIFLSSENFERLKEILEIPKMPKGEFSFKTSKFFKEFNEKIPSTLPEYTQSPELKQILARHYNSQEEEKKIYVLGMIDWTTKTKGSYTKENREKTRILYPEIYQAIKDKNISIKYTANEAYRNNRKFEDCKKLNQEEE